jgi:hypothetical protein
MSGVQCVHSPVATYARAVIVAQTTLFILKRVDIVQQAPSAAQCSMRVCHNLHLILLLSKCEICICYWKSVCAAVAHIHSMSET